MQLFLQLVFVGLASGAIYALIALGYTMVYGIIELINFAHGDIFMIGTLISISTLNLLGVTDSSRPSGWTLLGMLILACLAAMLVSAVLGVLIERIAYRPLRNAPRLAPLISAIGVSLILEDVGKLWKGVGAVPFPQGIHLIFVETNYNIGPIVVNAADILVIIVALVLMVSLQWLVTRTRIGRAMRAVAQDREAAALMGVNVNRIIAITFFIGAGLAGAAGFIYGIKYGTTVFTIGFQLGLIAFTAAVLGGIGNLVGAMLGGLLIGLIEAMATYIPDSETNIVHLHQLGLNLDFHFGLPQGGGAWTRAIIFAILILILVFRPSGLLGQHTPEKV